MEINNQSIDAMVRSLFMVGVSERTLTDELRQFLLEFRPGSVILTLRLFQQNGATKKDSLTELCKSLHELKDDKELLIGIDHEGGFIQHLPPPTYTHIPTASRVGATENPSIANRCGQVMGRELRALGIDWNFAPGTSHLFYSNLQVLDVPTNAKYHFAHIQRTLSHNPEIVATMGASLISGMQSEGLIACPKHFPGMGRTEQDSHISTPVITAPQDALLAVDLLPFKKAIEAGAESIMTNHGLFVKLKFLLNKKATYTAFDPNNCATLSPILMTELLRKEMNFQGIILTDDLGMAGVLHENTPGKVAIDAINAGVDVLMFSYRPERAEEALKEVQQAVETGKIRKERIIESYQRLMHLKQKQKKRLEELEPVTHDVLGCEGHLNLIKEIDEIVPPQEMGRKNMDHRVGSDVKLKKEKCKVM